METLAIWIAVFGGFITVLLFLDKINENLEEIVRLLNADDELDETWFEEPECPTCKGKGEITAGISAIEVPCPTCQPKGDARE